MRAAWCTAGSSLSALVLFIYCVTLAWSHCTVGEVTNRGEPQQTTFCLWFMASVDFCRSLSIICLKRIFFFLLGYGATKPLDLMLKNSIKVPLLEHIRILRHSRGKRLEASISSSFYGMFPCFQQTNPAFWGISDERFSSWPHWSRITAKPLIIVCDQSRDITVNRWDEDSTLCGPPWSCQTLRYSFPDAKELATRRGGRRGTKTISSPLLLLWLSAAFVEVPNWDHLYLK